MTKYYASVSYSNPMVNRARTFAVNASTPAQAKEQVRRVAAKYGPVFQVTVRPAK